MSTRVLVAFASKSGSTAEIAEALGAELRLHGLDVTVRRADRAPSLRNYHAVVLGSPLYAGRWRRSALRLLRRERATLRQRRVWLFQSGLSVTGAHPAADPTPDVVRRLAVEIDAAPPRTFAGCLLPETARGPMARAMAHGPSAGDYRDWEAIRAWAREVAVELHGARSGAGRSG